MSITRKPASTMWSADYDQTIEQERRLIDQARNSIEAGEVVTDDKIDAWLDQMIDSDEPLPIPTIAQHRRKAGG